MSNDKQQVNLPRVIHLFVIPLYCLLNVVKYMLVANLPIKDLILLAIMLYMVILLFYYIVKTYIIHDKLKAAIITSITVPFLSFVDIMQALDIILYHIEIRLRLVGVILLVIWLSAIYLIWRTPKRLLRTTTFFNVAGIILVLFNLYNIGKETYYIKKVQAEVNKKIDPMPETMKQDKLSGYPDIYYIITDAHANFNALAKYWHYSELSFINTLRNKGFYVALNSRSNYKVTWLSIASTLNMEYISDWDKVKYLNNDLQIYLARKLIKGNKLLRYLISKGYDIKNLSLFDLAKHNKVYPDGVLLSEIKSVWSVFFDRTLAYHVGVYFDFFPGDEAAKDINIQIIKDINLQIISDLSEFNHRPRTKPAFIYFHLMMPHFPYFYDSKGGVVDWRYRGITDEKKEYLQQLIYTDKLLIQIVNEILSSSQLPPIIVVQGDHGARILNGKDQETESYMILNAYFMPNGGDKLLYDSISPVNTFRVILNHYFDANLPLLPDESYHSPAGTAVWQAN